MGFDSWLAWWLDHLPGTPITPISPKRTPMLVPCSLGGEDLFRQDRNVFWGVTYVWPVPGAKEAKTRSKIGGGGLLTQR